MRRKNLGGVYDLGINWLSTNKRDRGRICVINTACTVPGDVLIPVVIVGGKKITDDYDEAAARERGDVEGELAVPEDRLSSCHQ
jgi:hypothetical protein